MAKSFPRSSAAEHSLINDWYIRGIHLAASKGERMYQPQKNIP
jgi:hypothetical protein